MTKQKDHTEREREREREKTSFIYDDCHILTEDSHLYH